MSTQRIARAEDAEVIQLGYAEDARVLHDERACRFFRRARIRLRCEVVHHVGRSAEIVPAGGHVWCVYRCLKVVESGELRGCCLSDVRQMQRGVQIEVRSRTLVKLLDRKSVV